MAIEKMQLSSGGEEFRMQFKGGLREIGIIIALWLLHWLAGRLGVAVLRDGFRAVPVSHVSFDPLLAVQIGLNEAIIFQTVKRWAEYNARRGRAQSTFNSYPAWREQCFPFMSESTIKRTFLRLEDAGLLASERVKRNGAKVYFVGSNCTDGQTNLNRPSGQIDPAIGSKRPRSTADTSTESTPSKRLQTTTTARAKPAAAGKAQTGPIEQLMRPEAVEGRDEHEPHEDALAETGEGHTVPIPPVPRAPLPIVQKVRDFGLMLTDAEIEAMVKRYGEARIADAIEDATGKTLKNPPGFVVAQLRKFPTGAPARSSGEDGMSYVGGEFGKFIRH